jgi:hypothetical protein
MGIACVIVLTAVLGCDRPALQFSPTTLSDAQVGSAYSATITVSQAETPVYGASVVVGALPAGLDLTLDHSAVGDGRSYTVQISGTPTDTGTFHFTIEADCYGTSVNGQTGTQGYTIVVK